MKKRLFTILVLLAAAPAIFGLTWRTDSIASALAQAKAEGKLLLIDFFTEYG